MLKRFIFTIIVCMCIGNALGSQVGESEQTWLELKAAIKNGDLAKVKTIVPGKIDINAKTNTYGSIFDLAAGNNEI